MVAGRAHDNWVYRKRRRAHASVGSASCRGARPNRKKLRTTSLRGQGSVEAAVILLGVSADVRPTSWNEGTLGERKLTLCEIVCRPCLRAWWWVAPGFGCEIRSSTSLPIFATELKVRGPKTGPRNPGGGQTVPGSQTGEKAS